MSGEIDQSADQAQDGYVEYYTEKLWSWVPGFYREEDASTTTPGTLREIIESMGAQSAELRRALDRLWENSFVELADDDALVELGELVATRMVHELNRRARRVDVARTIYYRRRKGTPWVLERLINDIAGWTGCHLDTRRRLARSYHLLEPRPPLSSVSLTSRGGWANLRSARIPELAWTAFEELNHTPDFRRQHGHEGRYGISKIGVHVHRMRALKVTHPTVTAIDTDKFTFDPSGRAVPLFQPADRQSGESWTRPREWQMPRVIERRLLAHEEYEWNDAGIEALTAGLTANAIALLQRYSGWQVRSIVELRRLIDSFPAIDEASIDFDELRAATVIADCGSARLYGSALALAIGADNTAADLARERVLIADLGEWGTNIDPTLIAGYDLVIDPVRGAALGSVAPGHLIAPVLHVGADAEIGAGSYDRRASIVSEGAYVLDGGLDDVGPVGLVPSGFDGVVDEVPNSKTYTPPDILDDVEDYRLQAANLERPYLLVSNNDATWTIDAKVKTDDELRCLVLDGLWIGVADADAELPVILDNADDPIPLVAGKLVISGTWDRVEIRHCTLDPGGEKLRVTPTECVPIPYVTLELQGYVEELIIDSSIVGPIREAVVGADPCSVGKIMIRDSIAYSPDLENIAAITTQFAELHLERTTVAGNVVANRLYATDSLIAGAGTVADLQHGCFRFSAGVQSNWPRPYESYLFSAIPHSAFQMAKFGEPGFLRLTEQAPVEMREGAENHCEMGAYNKLIEAIKRADLRNKLDEFMPFDLIEQIISEN